MKSLIIASITMFLGLFATQTFAQTEVPMEKKMEMKDDKVKTAVEMSELPAQIRTTLASNDYAEWQAQEAWKVTKEDGKVYYKVNATKGSERTTLKFDADGNIVDKDKKSKS